MISIFSLPFLSLMTKRNGRSYPLRGHLTPLSNRSPFVSMKNKSDEAATPTIPPAFTTKFWNPEHRITQCIFRSSTSPLVASTLIVKPGPQTHAEARISKGYHLTDSKKESIQAGNKKGLNIIGIKFFLPTHAGRRPTQPLPLSLPYFYFEGHIKI